MSRASQQREAEWQFKAEMRRKHGERLQRERITEAKLRTWLALLRHQDQFSCERCGRPSSGPLVLPAVDVLLQAAVIDHAQSADLRRCAVCGGWLCTGCQIYVDGLGLRCRAGPAGCQWSTDAVP